MKVIQSVPKSRFSQRQAVAAAPPVQHHRGRMIAVIVFAVVILVAIILFIAYGKQIAGKAIAVAPEGLAVGQAGIAGVSLSAGSSMTINKPDYFDVYANFPLGKDANGFDFRVSYDPTLIQFLAPTSLNENAALSGVIIMDNSVQVIDPTHSVLHISGTTIEIAPAPTHSLRFLAGKTDVKSSALIPLAHLQFLALKQSASAKLTFDYIMIPDVTDNTNIISSSANYVNPEFKIEGVGETCNNGKDDNADGLIDCEDALCSTDLYCKDTDGDGFIDSKDNCPLIPNADELDYQADSDGEGIGDICDNCPTVVNKDQADLNGNKIGDACEKPVVLCSSSTLGACTTQVQCNDVKVAGLWNNGVCVKDCPAGTEPNYGTMTCVVVNPEICTDAQDNDKDGKSDCSDSDCYSSSACYQKACSVNTDCGIDSGVAKWLCLESKCYVQMKTGGTFDKDQAACVAVGFANILGYPANQFACVQCQNTIGCAAGSQCVNYACVAKEQPSLSDEQSCTSDFQCASKHCANPLSGTDKICCPTNQCNFNPEDGVCEVEGSKYAEAAYADGIGNKVCQAGVWTSIGGYCGDNVKDVNEQCDITGGGPDFGGQTCSSKGYASGQLNCNAATCTVDVSACVAEKITLVGDTDNIGCLSLLEYNKFKEDYKGNINGIQDTVTLLQYNTFKENYKSNVGDIQC